MVNVIGDNLQRKPAETGEFQILLTESSQEKQRLSYKRSSLVLFFGQRVDANNARFLEGGNIR